MQVDVNLKYVPLKSQLEFHRAPHKFRAYVGGFGSGKTLSGCMESLFLSLEYPGNLGVVARKTYPELRDTTMRTFFNICPPSIIKSFNKAEHHLTLINGSEILFRSLDDPEKIKMELGFAYIDEASEVDEESFLMFTGRIRKPEVPRRCVFITSNPTTTEHWIYKYFVKKDQLEDSSDYMIIQASTLENVHLPKDYIANLLTNYPPSWVDRFVKGKFGYVGTGDRIYPGFAEDLHVRPLRHIKNKPILRGWDFGFVHPAVVLAQIDSHDRFQVLREFMGSRIMLDRFAEQVINYCASEFPGAEYEDFCDPAGMQTSDKSEKTSIQILGQFGVHPGYRKSSVLDGLSLLRMKMDRNIEGRPAMVVDPSCKLLIEGFLGGYRCRTNRDGSVVKDEPEQDGYFEHTMDALRYIAINKFDVDQVLGRRIIRKHERYQPLFTETAY